MAKAKNFKKVIKKPSILDFLKGLTAWLCKRHAPHDELVRLLDRFPDVSINFVFNRMMSYNMTYPHLIWFFNKYLNNFYEFSALSSNKVVHRENIIRLVHTFKYNMDLVQQSNRSNLFYLKGNDLKDENRSKIKKLLDQYFKTIYDKSFNDKELDHFYTMFEKGLIYEEDLYKADEALNNGKRKLKLNMSTTGFDSYKIPDADNSILTPTQYLAECRKKKPSDAIFKYCNDLKDIKKDMLALDTNVEDFSKLDVMFIKLNPGGYDYKHGTCSTDDADVVLREKIMKLNPTTKWMITNLVMCHTFQEKDLGKDAPEIINNCAGVFMRDVISKFKPTLLVPIGRQAMETCMGKGDGITKESGKVHVHKEYKIIPLLHPAAVARSKEKNGAIFENSWKTIFEHAEVGVYNVPCCDDPAEKTCSMATVDDHAQCGTFLNEANVITDPTDDMLLFDIVAMNNEKIVMIYIDEYGVKKYQYVDYTMPIYVKNNVNWNQNTIITDTVDFFVTITGKNRYYVNKLLRDKLEQIKDV